jgi:hypothetical protein
MQTSKLDAKDNRPTPETIATDTNATEDAQVSGSHPHQVPSSDNTDTVPRRGRGDAKFQKKISREISGQAAPGRKLAASDASTSTNTNTDGNAPPGEERGQEGTQVIRNTCSPSSTADNQSLAQSDASTGGNAPPGKERGQAGIQAYRNKCSRSSTADDQSLVQSNASAITNGNAPPRKELGQANIQTFQNKFSHSSPVAGNPESESIPSVACPILLAAWGFSSGREL